MDLRLCAHRMIAVFCAACVVAPAALQAESAHGRSHADPPHPAEVEYQGPTFPAFTTAASSGSPTTIRLRGPDGIWRTYPIADARLRDGHGRTIAALSGEMGPWESWATSSSR